MSFWGDLGTDLGQSMARKSPIGQAVYKGITGEEVPNAAQGSHRGPLSAAIARYRQQPHAPEPPQPPAGNGFIPDVPPAVDAPIPDDPSMGAGPTNPIAPVGSDLPERRGGGAGMISGFAEGGVAGEGMMAKVGESGPEMAGGRLVTSPMIVKLEKGERVVPLTARPGNKLSMDAMPHMGYQRYRRGGR